MGAGSRNRLISIERRSVTTDDFGGEIETWGTLTEAYAAVSFGTGQERRQAAQEVAALMATFQILADSKTRTITVQDRIQFDGVWDISSAVPSRELNMGIDLTATRAA